MQYYFLASLNGLKLSDKNVESISTNSKIKVTNNLEKIRSFIDDGTRITMGQLEFNALVNGNAIAYFCGDFGSDDSLEIKLLTHLYQLQSLLMTTWLTQDNSINFDNGFAFIPNNSITTNYIAHQYTTSQAEKTITEISVDNLNTIIHLHNRIFDEPKNPDMPVSQLTHTHKQNRASRAIYMLNLARGEPDLAIKIAHYCAALETLFATSQSELTHQLSERVACFVHNAGDERLELYKFIKQTYSIRSTVVHGSTLPEKKASELNAISCRCDDILRDILYKILNSDQLLSLFNQTTNTFDETMIRMVLTESRS
ncbi:HEPN domain-containing protein [uncultured Tolumonas sp.]|uniref:HEPN domain-containing protein n=1 Tax=uncultured Tolumonas sp. TaxID=263765 RepID=UPI002A0A1917|nr:HEPN domain-containing protein [uncultured Tolumonas sp.]